ncbi:hypothetical protein AMS68_002949 [Peltaster fructicola]|uniref:F-box domain-containing protein n=1 Tax=Peltaster fructicola TaxID=286661 RepID=A0A6H0XRP1_9PEZI|nr:hypothetical protein AMS68_002949 [Peltaster fructicola]
MKRTYPDIAAAMPTKRLLRPAIPKNDSTAGQGHARTSFYDLPAELRIEIYQLVLEKVTIHILPTRTATNRECPHALVRTSRQVRNEVLPIIHAQCPIKTTVTDFNFDGMMAWMSRMPPDQEANLCRNQWLSIELVTTVNDRKEQSSNSMKNSHSLRRWLHMRADRHRPQPGWKYKGPTPDPKTANEMRRRAKRAVRPEEQREMYSMLKALNVRPPVVRQQPSPPDSSGTGD